MSNTCPRCQQSFPQWIMYRMHEELCRREVPPVKQLAGVKKPYTKEQKATIVARGEARIGHHHFIGGK